MEEGKKRILITGSDGFIAKNLICELKNRGYENLLLWNRGTSESEWKRYLNESDVIVHLAGINRPANEAGYRENLTFAEQIIEGIGEGDKKIIFASSIQAELDNPYGRSKRQAEEALLAFADKSTNVRLAIYRLPNVFGKWCRPNYNSVVATFCNNIARGIDIKINDPLAEVRLVYVDDVVNAFIDEIEDKNTVTIGCGAVNGAEEMGVSYYREISERYVVTVGELARLIQSFNSDRSTLGLPNMSEPLHKKLYSTYLSYLEQDKFKYGLKMNVDARGSFTEFLRSDITGQVSINVAKPGIVKGNHWHHTKVEKFLVVSGTASIKFRHMVTGNVIEYIVSGDKLEVVDIPPGYTHNIANIGNDNLVTVMWANEAFDKEHPDTFCESV